jgi:hypothetical protein
MKSATSASGSSNLHAWCLKRFRGKRHAECHVRHETAGSSDVALFSTEKGQSCGFLGAAEGMRTPEFKCAASRHPAASAPKSSNRDPIQGDYRDPGWERPSSANDEASLEKWIGFVGRVKIGKTARPLSKASALTEFLGRGQCEEPRF